MARKTKYDLSNFRDLVVAGKSKTEIMKDMDIKNHPTFNNLMLKLMDEDKKYYQIDNRDSHNFNLKAETVFLYGANRIGIAAVGEIEDAQADVYSYDQVGGLINYERLLPYDLMFLGYYEYRYRKFEGNQLLFDKKRRDNLHFAGAGRL